MSREVRTTPRIMSIDPDEVPAGMMALTFLVPLAEAENVRLGSPVTLTFSEAPATPRQESCPAHLMDGRNEIRCWLTAGHKGDHK